MPEMKSIVVAALALACACCGKPKDQPAEGPPVPDQAECVKILDEIRAIRSGPQKCKTDEECTVWHNGEFWDGCPPEVTKVNAGTLDGLREKFEKAGCTANTKGHCGPRITRGCTLGECGREPPILKLRPEQRKKWEEYGKETTEEVPAGCGRTRDEEMTLQLAA